MNKDPKQEHCPECYHEQSSGGCLNPSCVCHTPLKVVVGEVTEVTAEFGAPPPPPAPKPKPPSPPTDNEPEGDYFE